MDFLTVLAQTAEVTDHTATEAVVPIDLIWEYVTSLNYLEAVTFVSFGAVCLMYGWRVFKILVVISFGLLGLTLGAVLGDRIQGNNSQLWGGFIGLGLLAGFSIPLMRYAVSVLGAIAGGVLTSALWYAFGLTEQYIWAGALIGMIAGGMVSFIVFRIAVMLFSSLGGSSLIVIGLLALLYLYQPTSTAIKELVLGRRWFLTAALLIPTTIGLIVQNKFIKASKEWRV